MTTSTPEEHQKWMSYAIELAHQADQQNEVPVGCVIVQNDAVIGEGWNQPISSCDATGHAEIVAIRQACQQLNNYRLPGAKLYVTIEPCTMCLGAMIHARIDTLVFGALEPKAGAIVSAEKLQDKSFFNHKLDVISGVLETECSQLISSFFQRRRIEKKNK